MIHRGSCLKYHPTHVPPSITFAVLKPIPIRKGSTIHFLDKMATCGHEECFIDSPPSLEFMAEYYPLITPNEEIDRSIPRCRLCDLTAASAGESAAVYSHPTFSSRVEALQRYITSVEQLIAERIRKEELEAILPSIQKMLTDEISATENRMLEAWKEHWAIWGLGEGPEMPNVYLEEQLAEEVVERSAGRQQAITQVPVLNQGQSLCEESKTVLILDGEECFGVYC